MLKYSKMTVWSELAGTAPLGSLDAWQGCFFISSAAFSRQKLDTDSLDITTASVEHINTFQMSY